MSRPDRAPLYVHIDAELAQRLKGWCERQGLTMRYVVEEALKDALARAEALEEEIRKRTSGQDE